MPIAPQVMQLAQLQRFWRFISMHTIPCHPCESHCVLATEKGWLRASSLMLVNGDSRIRASGGVSEKPKAECWNAGVQTASKVRVCLRRAAATTMHQGQLCPHPKRLWESGTVQPHATLTSLAKAPHQVRCNPGKEKEHWIGTGLGRAAAGEVAQVQLNSHKADPSRCLRSGQPAHSDLGSHRPHVPDCPKWHQGPVLKWTSPRKQHTRQPLGWTPFRWLSGSQHIHSCVTQPPTSRPQGLSKQEGNAGVWAEVCSVPGSWSAASQGYIARSFPN